MRIELYTPQLRDLWFRKNLLADPETMSYNKGYNLGFPQYHNDTGCIDFPQKDWGKWYHRWVLNRPERFYAYLRKKGTGEFLGEVSLYQTDAPGVYEMGIVLHSACRGKGYAREGMALLLDAAFRELGVQEVVNHFETSRQAAMKIHLAAGFRIVTEENGVTLFSVKRADRAL